jgi:hypothetical protein
VATGPQQTIRVTSGWRAGLTWLVLALFALYQVAGFTESRADGNGPFRKATGDHYWPVNWKMFTGMSKTHTIMEFEGRRDGKWVVLPMHEWYPARWESGYRWERPWVYRWRSLQVPFLSAACQHSGTPYVRLIQRSWDKTLGQQEQPRGKVREKLLRNWDCSSPFPMPSGRVL